jgi:hypothetical protein
MTGKFKILILLVALVALPLRGMAAVAMWHCAQGKAETAVSADSHAGHHKHDDHSAAHSHEAPSHDDAAEHPASPVATSCSACAACCMGGTIAPSAWSAFSFAVIGASRIAFVEPHFTGVVPAQLERPPHVQPR